MNRELIISIIKSYENQLSNAEIKGDLKEIKFLTAQIHEANRSLATCAAY